MHELPANWKQGSLTYTQVWRDGDLAIYRQRHDGGAQRFEVIRAQHRGERVFPGGKVQEAGEYYPGSSQWGQDGWTCFSLADAHALAGDLQARRTAGNAPEEAP